MEKLMVDITVKKLINVLPKVFISENAKNTRASIQIIATGSEGGEWGIHIINQTCRVEEGQVNNPDFSLIATADDILKIFLGELDPLRAYMQGKIQFKGRIKHALALTDIFLTDKSQIEAMI
jgi:putative sterol carrier protein